MSFQLLRPDPVCSVHVTPESLEVQIYPNCSAAARCTPSSDETGRKAHTDDFEPVCCVVTMAAETDPHIETKDVDKRNTPRKIREKGEILIMREL